MRVSNRAGLGLAAAWLLAGAAVTSGCSNSTDGNPSCPGCGSQAEPSIATLRPTVSSRPSVPTPSPPPSGPAPTATASPPRGAERLPPDDQGYVFIETKSGKTRCQISNAQVGCEAEFVNSPMQDGAHSNGVTVTADGTQRWVLGNLGDIPAVTLDYKTYLAAGWTIAADSSGTRFTNDRSGHGMFVSVERVEVF